MSPKEKIALLNDKARKGLLPESTKVLLTRMVAALPDEEISYLRRNVAAFDAFTEDNDPYRERDFGAVELNGERYFWKIDYYDTAIMAARGTEKRAIRREACLLLLAVQTERSYNGTMREGDAAREHFRLIGEVTEKVNREREQDYDRMTPLERVALGLTLYREQLALKRAMLGEAYEPEPERPSFSIKALYDAAQARSAP